MTGQVLGNRYEVQELLGQGGMAQVYRAHDRVLGRSVAIKILRAEYAADATLVARFQREARAAANLVHPNIVAVYDVGQEGGQYYIVMEFISGPTLKEIIRQRAPLTVEFTCKVGEQVSAALEYAHRRGVIHRDIKPQNILLSEDEEVIKVADFGIAKTQIDPETTADRLALGTVKYISPEQARGIEVVPQSDIYSLGVVLYEMLTGEQPFDGETPVSIALQHAEALPRPPRELNPYLPPAVEGLVLRALTKDPRERFPTARELRLALERYRLAGFEATGPIPQAGVRAPQASTYPPRPIVSSPEAYTRAPYTAPRRAVSRERGGLGLLGIVLLVMIAASLAGLVFLLRPFLEQSLPKPSTPTPTATPTLTPLPQVFVPDVTTLSLDEARARLEQYGLVLVEGEPRFDPYVLPGYVVAQEPQYGVKVTQGSTVTVSLGKEPELKRVSQVVQLRYEVAKATLEMEGFRVDRGQVGCANTPLGYVDHQDPLGGQMEFQGITVTLYVSIGDQAVLPELLRVPLSVALRRIEEAGLVVGYVNPQTQENMPPGVDIDDVGAPGQVISYEVFHGGRRLGTNDGLPQGSLVPCGATLNIAYYSTGP